MDSLVAAPASASGRRPLRRAAARATALVLAIIVLTSWLAVFQAAGATAANAEEPPDGISSAPPDEAPPAETPPAPSPEAAVTIDSPGAGAFVPSATVDVGGTRSPDAGIRLTSGSVLLCELPANGRETWNCAGLTLSSGPTVTLSAEAITGGTPVASYSHAVAVLRPPTISGGGSNGDASNGVIRGTGYPGATVTVGLDTGESCSFGVDTGGSWSCLLPAGFPRGTHAVTATQSAGFAGGVTSNAGSAILRFDPEPPAAPTLTASTATPRAGESVRLSGMGEPGTTARVFSGASSLCTAPIGADGTWSCTVILGAGILTLRAVAQDAAGNVSKTSAVLSLTVSEAAASAAPQPAPPSPTAQEPKPQTSPGPETPLPDPTAAAAQPEESGIGGGLVTPGNWNDPSNFAAVTPVDSIDTGLWPRSIGIALAGLLLLAIPARLLATALGPDRTSRIRRAFGGLAGRNRGVAEFDVAPTLAVPSWILGAGVLLLGAVFVVLARPIESQPAYLRLVVAIMVALTIVNAAVVTVGILLARIRWRERVRPVVTPSLLFLVAGASLLSRMLELSPPLLFGVVTGVGVAITAKDAAASIVDSGALASVRVTTLLILGAGAWSALPLVPTGGGVAPAFLTDVLGAVAMGGLGSATILLLPVGTFDGRVILARSPLVWVGLTVISGTLLAAALTPSLPLGNGVTTAITATIAGTFALACLTVWVLARRSSRQLR